MQTYNVTCYGSFPNSQYICTWSQVQEFIERYAAKWYGCRRVCVWRNDPSDPTPLVLDARTRLGARYAHWNEKED